MNKWRYFIGLSIICGGLALGNYLSNKVDSLCLPVEGLMQSFLGCDMAGYCAGLTDRQTIAVIYKPKLNEKVSYCEHPLSMKWLNKKN